MKYGKRSDEEVAKGVGEERRKGAKGWNVNH
jgi:hypothetical protein